MESCLELERASEGASWPSTETSLKLLVGLAVCRQQTQDHQAAIDALQTSLKLAESLFDNFDDRTAEISTRLKLISERYEIGLQQHKAVVVASTGSKLTEKGTQLVRETRPSTNSEDLGSGSSNDHLFDSVIYPCIEAQRWDDLRDIVADSTYNVNALIHDGRTLLMHVLCQPTQTAAELILRERSGDIDVEASDYRGETAIFYAAINGHCKIIRLLISKHGADPNAENIDGQTVLCRLVTSKRTGVDMLGVARELIEAGADPQTPDLKGFTAFMGAVSILKNKHMASIFFHSGKVNINHQDIRGDTALHLSLRYYNSSSPYDKDWTGDMLRLLVGWDADVNVRNLMGKTAFDISTGLWATPDVIRLLLTPQADVTARDDKGKTPLIMAAALGEPKTAKALLEYSAVDVNAQDQDGMSALFHAIKLGDYDVVRLLLQRPELNMGAYGHGIGKEYNSVLYAAIHHAHDGCLRLLIQKSRTETLEAIRLGNEKHLGVHVRLIRDIG